MNRLIFVTLALLLSACERTQPPTFFDQLLDASPPQSPWSLEEILYSHNVEWPTLPIVEGAWCAMDTMYWWHRAEASLDKDALVLDKEDGEWHLWVYSYIWDLGNDPVPGRGTDIWSTVHCKINPELKRLQDLSDDIPWKRNQFEFYQNHYWGMCERAHSDDERVTGWSRSLIRLQGLGGRVTLSIGSVDRLFSQDPIEEEDRISGGWAEMGTCPWIDHPYPKEELTSKDRDRVKKWVWSPLGEDAELDDTAEEATARTREYIESQNSLLHQ